jgi:hypothetical protein
MKRYFFNQRLFILILDRNGIIYQIKLKNSLKYEKKSKISKQSKFKSE